MENIKIFNFGLIKFFCTIIVASFFVHAKAQTLVIDSVSVLPDTNHVIIGWSLSGYSGNGYFEVHKRMPDNSYQRIHTTTDIDESFYIDNSTDVESANSSHSYYLVAFNPELSSPMIAFSRSHETIFLQQLNPDFCQNSIEASWFNYQVATTFASPVPQPVPFTSIRVQFSTDGISFQNAAMLDHPPISSGIQNHTVQLPGPGLYHFRTQAHSSSTDYTSTSNIRQVGFNPPQITNIEIISIDVVDNREIEIIWNAIGNTNDFRYVFFRSDNASDGFEPIDTLIQIQPFIDQDVEIGEGPWFYKVIGYLNENECEIPAFETLDDQSSIFLSANVNLSESRINIAWQHHSPNVWNYQLQEYHNGSWQNVVITPSGMMQGFYGIDLGQVAGTITLRIAATNGTTIIHSNHTIISIEPQVFIPNAFRPSSADSRNTTFKPIIPGYNPSQYQLIVFDRWGLKIFESSDKEIGWDGTVNGTNAQPGAYSYLLRFSGLDDETIEKRGMVVLVN